MGRGGWGMERARRGVGMGKEKGYKVSKGVFLGLYIGQEGFTAFSLTGFLGRNPFWNALSPATTRTELKSWLADHLAAYSFCIDLATVTNPILPRHICLTTI